VTHQLRIVDVFTEKPLAGNQLAVVLDGEHIPDDVMQLITREMNFSETVFVLPPRNPNHAARLRIFTPAGELPFAGHPTIGTAWTLWNEGLVRGDALEFTLEEGVGPVPVRGVKDGDRVRFWMTHPRLEFGEVIADRDRFASALGLGEAELVPDLPIQVASTGAPFAFAALKSPEGVDRARPGGVGPGVAVFIFAVAGEDRLYSRMFAGEVGDVREDPATGSASGPLGAFAVKYGLAPRRPKVSLVSEQGTKMGRQSFIHIELTYGDDPEIPMLIEIGGAVCPVVSGTLSDFG
jgi:trans-2,3-dihydro-3-hydroxyanthranilate isomerase